MDGKMQKHDTANANLAQLEEQVASLSRRVETGIAELKARPNTLSSNEGQRRSSQRSSRPRRKSSVVEELARQVQQLTDDLAEKDAAIDERTQRSGALRNKSVGFTLALSYADLISDLVLAVVLLRGAQAAYGVASLVTLSVSLFLQVLAIRLFGNKPWLSKDTLL
jgi:hypothetical protein